MTGNHRGLGFFRQILAAATLLLFGRQACCVPVPKGLTLQDVTDVICPNGTYHKCLPYGDCYSFDKYCDSHTRSVEHCFQTELLEDREKLLAWCLRLKKGEVELPHPACRFACDFTFIVTELTPIYEENETTEGASTEVTVDQWPCQCERCLSSCDYTYDCQCQECSTQAPVDNKTSDDTNWDHRYKYITIVLATLLCISVGLNLYGLCTRCKYCPEQRTEKLAVLASSDSSLMSDQAGDEGPSNVLDLVAIRRFNNSGRPVTSASRCNCLSSCFGTNDRVLE